MTQRKETGTPVDFMKAIQFDTLQVYTYRGDVIGLLGYQGIPSVLDSVTRDALLNGNIADVVNQATGQGMQADYALISWNETSQSNGYYITDMQIGIVVTITRDFNTGPAYLLDALKAVPWLKSAITNLGSNWKAWKLLSQKRTEPYNQWVHESRSQVIRASSTNGEANLPPLPDVATVKASIKSQGNFQQAMGEFITQMVDKGYSVTFPTNSYDIDICYEKGNVFVTHSGGPVGGYDTWNYDYYVHVRFWWEFTTDPEITTATLNGARRLLALTASIIYGIIIIIGLLAIGGIGVYNLTTTRTEYQQWGWRYNPNTGQWEWVVVESGSSQGPPDWWAWVVPIIALIGAGAVVYFLLPLRPKRRESE